MIPMDKIKLGDVKYITKRDITTPSAIFLLHKYKGTELISQISGKSYLTPTIFKPTGVPDG
jgi:hypothetical protein